MEHKVTKTKKLEKDLNLKISEDIYTSRIYVEFYSDDRKFVLQRSFQNNFFGKRDGEEFSKTIKNLSDLKKRLGYTK